MGKFCPFSFVQLSGHHTIVAGNSHFMFCFSDTTLLGSSFKSYFIRYHPLMNCLVKILQYTCFVGEEKKQQRLFLTNVLFFVFQ